MANALRRGPVAPGVTLVTAIVAAYNEERHIEACLRSLAAQTWTPLEIVVADDGSTDRTGELAARHAGVHVLTLSHAGKARAVNAAAREARGEVLVFLDGDLVYSPGYVERLVEPILAGRAAGTSHADELVANPEALWSRCMQAHYGLPEGRRLNLTPEQRAQGTPVFRAVRRDRFLAVGGFDDTGYLDDQSLAPKLGARAAFVEGAECRHHNPDRLTEVFRHGAWAGKSVWHLHGGRAALRYAPPLAVGRALAAAWQHRFPALAVYVAVYETGVCWGVVKRALKLERHAGA
jgi:glycosyltransferase involved in cell wall biosynthesis